MTNLPAQQHQSSTAVATAADANPYAIDQSMVKLPSLYLGQYSSKAFKASLVKFGDIYVGVGADDPSPVVVGAGKDGLSEPVRFYVHSCAPGYQIEDKDAAYGKRSLRPGTTFQQALAEVGDPRKVFLQTYYSLTIPEYPLFPVRFIMGSKWGGSAARWINFQLASAMQQKQNPLDLAFQLQTKATHNDRGDFVEAIVGFAAVAAKDAEADQELVQAHADLLSSGAVDTSYDDVTTTVDTSEAPSLG